MTCTARLRPMRPVNETELVCSSAEPDHTKHAGELRDYAYPGSVTTIVWFDDDRRSFSGEWPGECPAVTGCILPAGHPGNCAP